MMRGDTMYRIKAALAASFVVFLVFVVASCGDTINPTTGVLCGPGTTAVMEVCLPNVTMCGTGTHLSDTDGTCVTDTASSTTVQTGTLAVPPEGTPPSGWDTEFSVRLGVTLIAQLDSSGPDAWDVALHPDVMFTTVGPGYGGFEVEGVQPGVVVIDSTTGEVLADTQYTFADWTDYFEPHGLGVSPDGRWIYLPTGDGRSNGRFLIINARTLLVDKILGTRGRPHHSSAFTDADGNPRALLYGWGQPPFVLDPMDDNRVVGGVDAEDTGGDGYLWFVTPDGTELWGGSRHRMHRGDFHESYIMRVDTRTWELIDWIVFPGENTPVWIDFSADNLYAYVTGGHSSTVLKFDRTTEETLAIARAGVEGPYGIRSNWDGTELWTVGKGEGSHNQGRVMGLVDAIQMEVRARPVTQVLTDCLRGDHATLHPDPAVNEMWVSCNSSFEMIRFSLDTREVTQRIPMPYGGSTHSGAFVSYDSGWNGTLLSDHNGLHGSAREMQASMAVDHHP